MLGSANSWIAGVLDEYCGCSWFKSRIAHNSFPQQVMFKERKHMHRRKILYKLLRPDMLKLVAGKASRTSYGYIVSCDCIKRDTLSV
jgi:hypothetical protein